MSGKSVAARSGSEKCVRDEYGEPRSVPMFPPDEIADPEPAPSLVPLGDDPISPATGVAIEPEGLRTETKSFDLESVIRTKQERDVQPPDPDPFDPARLRLSQGFASSVGVRRIIATIPVRKPSKEWFVRTHPDDVYRLPTNVLELKEDREIYQVTPELWPALASEATFGPRLLIAAVNRQGSPFLWPIRLPGPDGRLDDWSRSAMDAAEQARTGWIRIAANMRLGAYDLTIATGVTAQPEWPDLDFRRMLEIAFRDKRIDSLDHLVLRRLRGEI